jgi:uncharacterized protein
VVDRAQALDRLVQQIVEAVHPLKIILFGSAARSNLQEGNDLDVLVVMPEGTHRLDTAGYLYTVIRKVGMPVDIIVATPSDLERHRDTVGYVYATVIDEGTVVYAA